MKRFDTSPRQRPPLRRVTFTDRIGQSLPVMQASFERGIELPHEEPQPGSRGAGVPLPQEW